MMKKMDLRRIIFLAVAVFFATSLLFSGGCGPGLKEENEKLKKETRGPFGGQ